MTLLAVSIAPESRAEIAEALQQAERSIRAGAAIVEWRIDHLADDPDAAALARRLVDGTSVPCIVTCRPTWEGGHFDGDDARRVALFEQIGVGANPPRYLDVELAAWTRSANLRQKVKLVVEHRTQVRTATTALMLSSHDFDGRPADLLRRLESMAAEPACAVVKVAWRARSLRDNLEAFELLAARHAPAVVLCMGPFGLPSRVLAKKFGAFLTFGSAEGGVPTAPGQPTVRELRERWRFDALTPATRVYGVVGWPVAHSRSPRLHNAAFDSTAFDGVHLPLPVPPEWEHFKATVGALIDDPRLDFRGASVTIPHKEHLVRLVRERGGRLDDASSAIGAANTLVVENDGAIRCMNTDIDAAVETLVVDGGLGEDGVVGTTVAVLGAGGAARAVAWGLASRGADVVVFNRDQDRAARLADELGARLRTIGAPGSILAGRTDAIGRGRFPVVVNCTPVGMIDGPDPRGSPLPDDVTLGPGSTVFDTVYNPRITPLLRDARAAGANAVGGLGMFIRQAAAQFQAWTGRSAPVAAWRAMMEAER